MPFAIVLPNSEFPPRPLCLRIAVFVLALIGMPAGAQTSDALNAQLFEAAGRGELASVGAILQKGADINFVDLSSQRTVLQSAVIGDLDVAHTGAHFQVVKLLLDRGAKPGERPGALGTPLFNAVGVNGVVAQTKEQVAIVELLLNRGASVGALSDVTSEHGPTPLHEAALHGHLESARLLIAHGADVNAVDPYRQTPLQELIGSPDVSCKRKMPLIQLLKQHGAKEVRRELPHRPDVGLSYFANRPPPTRTFPGA
jgi:hypothetical protein